MSTQTQAIAVQQKHSLIATMAEKYNMAPEMFLDAVKATCMPTKDVVVSNAHMAAFLMVAHEYKLNPLIREIFAFPSKSGGIQPIVSVDGWIHLITTHPAYAGMELSVELDDKKQKPISTTCRIIRKDDIQCPAVTEYFDECYRNTDPWNKMPKRMMRHKAIKEAGRVAFGFGGLMDPDEGLDAINITDQSTIMERTTNDAKEALKEKMGAKKSKPATHSPVELPQPSVPAAESSAQEPPSPALPQEQTVINPQPVANEPAADEPKINNEQRAAFLAKAEAKAQELGLNKDQAKAKMRELIFSFGYTKYVEIPASKFEDTLAALDTWTADADI